MKNRRPSGRFPAFHKMDQYLLALIAINSSIPIIFVFKLYGIYTKFTILAY